MKQPTRMALLALGFFATSTIMANEKPINGTVALGMDFGGTTLGSVVLSDGSTESIKSNEGIYLSVGGEYLLDESLLTRATIGYKFDSVTASNGELSFDRIPLEALVFKMMGAHQVGMGLGYHLSPSYDCKIDGICNFSTAFKNSLGWIVQYEYATVISRHRANINIGVRYSQISYSPKNEGSTEKANGFGIVSTFMF